MCRPLADAVLGVALAPVLEIRDLAMAFRVGRRGLTAVADLDLTVALGAPVALAGRWGSGKSVTGLCILGSSPAEFGAHRDGADRRPRYVQAGAEH